MLEPLHPFFPIMSFELIEKVITFPGHKAFESVHRVIDTVICDSILGEVVSANSVASIPRADQASPQVGLFFVPLLVLLFFDTTAQDPHRVGFVFVLRLFILN